MIRINQEHNNRMSFGEATLQEVQSHTYLASNVNKGMATDRAIKIRKQMARAPFIIIITVNK